MNAANTMTMRRSLLVACCLGAVATMSGPAFSQAKEIKVGGLTFLTGAFSSYGADIEKGIKLAVDKVNADGGVLGSKLVVDLQDTATDSAQAVTLLRRFNAASDVVAVVGPTSTPDLLALLPVARQLDVPTVTLGSQKPLSRDDFPDGVFRVALISTPELIGDVITKVAAAKKIRRVGLFMDRANDSSQAESKVVRDAIKRVGGVELAADEAYGGGDKDFSVLISKMMQANVDAMWLSGQTNEDVIIIPQARARGFKGVFLGGASLTDPKIVKLVGNAAPPFVIFTPLNIESDRPVVKDFVAAYHKAYGNAQIATLSAYSYDAVLLVADGIRRAGSANRKAIATAIGSTKGFQGVSGDYTYNGKGDNAVPVPYILEVGPAGTFVPMK
jgi:branched-chain amino acid transport system substrate-binding protein